MITPDQARQDYEAAVSALRSSALTTGLSSMERLVIRDAIRELTMRYLDQVEAEIHALTMQYEGFIASISEVVESLKGGGAPVSSVLTQLTGIVEKGSGLIGAVIGELPAPAAGVRKFRGATRRSPEGGSGGGGALRILCVHGVGHQEADRSFESTWNEAITQGLSAWNPARPFETRFVAYDDLFAAAPLTAISTAEAVLKLGGSGIGDLFRRRRGFGEMSESVRWTAGMVVQWAENGPLRAAARQRILAEVDAFQPEVVLAHSLGSLLCYDALARTEGRSRIARRTFVSFGSQIGNPFVRSTLGGRIEPLDSARQWFHLFNPHDDAFTARLRLTAPNFEQVETEFDIEGFLDHDAEAYLRHANTTNVVWQSVALAAAGARGLGRRPSRSAALLARQSARARPAAVRKPRRRALLVGINEYPKPADRLEGCVNDVFLMSSLLQERGFAADDIRVVLNERATARGVAERLEWLLEGTQDGQERVFYYSGHGAQIPGYGLGEKVDRKDECLVTYDFDWSRERALTDDQFYDLYSQLPYGTQFLAIFDCCHSGGMTRDGGARVRGLTPPDDIRHRELKWHPEHQMWVARDFKEVSRETSVLQSERSGAKQARFGNDGSVSKLGVAADLRRQQLEFKAACRDFQHKGPFMPVIFQACQETQYSYEYRHGVQSYGAFTYALGLILRDPETRRRQLTWGQLELALTQKLKSLKYDQKPNLVCPTTVKGRPVPWKPTRP